MAATRPRVLLVGRTRYTLPLSPGLEKKFRPLRERFALRVLATSADGRPHDDGVFRLVAKAPVLDGLLFYALLPLRVRRLAREFRPDVIIAQSPYEAACVHLVRVGAKVVVEVHGDWRTFTRLYGSPVRRAVAPFGDRLGTWAIRRAEAVRTLSDYTSGLVRAIGVEPAATFATYTDLEAFRGPVTPLPVQPAALFVGVLERYKNVDGLARAWRIAAPQLPGVALRLVGRGTERAVVEALVADLPGQTTWVERLTPAEVATALDDATCLVLPSRSEGLGRVIIEAFLRGRPVVAMGVGGIRDLVVDGVNGFLVDSDDELAAALVRLLRDPELAARLGEAATLSAGPWITDPEEFADLMEALVSPYTGAR
jgi:glycosyltransferase involved in cell wall biosynthesis